MAWGNPTPMALLRKRHLIETLRLQARVRDLEAERDQLLARAYHPSACEFWRSGDCTCGAAVVTGA